MGGAAAPAVAPAVAPWADAVSAAALLAIDPAGLGGAVVRGLPGPVRERWLAALKGLAGLPVRKVPAHADDARLLGGLDLVASLAAGRPIAERGLLADADGGFVLLPMAERLAPALAARLTAALDTGEVSVERDGFAWREPARFAVLALDEGLEADERASVALSDRLAFAPDLTGVALRETGEAGLDPAAIVAARARLGAVAARPDAAEILCGVAAALGVPSLRAPLLALRAARASAALAGRAGTGEEDLALAARLVLAPRATLLPAPDAEAAASSSPQDGRRESQDDAEPGRDAPESVVLAAALAALPPELLARLVAGNGRERARSPGQSGTSRAGLARGRPVGARSGDPRGGARLALIETLRAAAPWQRLRRAQDRAQAPPATERIVIRRGDLKVRRLVQRAQATAVFAVDASGSSAFHRLAEAKGAVELLLAEAYVRRDQVALIAFRGQTADLLLPPTRSLARAKRCLAALPGGGGTPLAAGIDAAARLADALRRRGQTAMVVLLTDGRGNITRAGTAGRKEAAAEALAAARALRAAGAAALLVDTSPQPREESAALAAAMGATYLALPHADASALSRAVRVGLDARRSEVRP